MEALSDEHIIIGEDDCYIEILDTKLMKIVKSNIFDDFQQINNIKKTEKEHILAVSTKNGLWFLLISIDEGYGFNFTFSLTKEHYYSKIEISGIAQVKENTIAVMTAYEGFVGIIDREQQKELHRIKIPGMKDMIYK